MGFGFYDQSTKIELPRQYDVELSKEDAENMDLAVFEELSYIERCALQRIAPDRYAKLVEAEKAQTAQKGF